MKTTTLLVILALLISGSTYAHSRRTFTKKGCYGYGKTIDFKTISAWTNNDSYEHQSDKIQQIEKLRSTIR